MSVLQGHLRKAGPRVRPSLHGKTSGVTQSQFEMSLLDAATCDLIHRILDEHPPADWSLTEAGWEPASKGKSDSRFGLSNGYIGMRGDLATPPEGESTYVAGYFKPGAGPAGVPALGPAPRPFPLSISVEGEELAAAADTLHYARSLDLRNGFLRSHWRLLSPSGGELQLQALRFASLAHRRLALQIVRLRPERSARLQLRTLASDSEAATAAESRQRPARSLVCLRHTALLVDGVRRPLAGEWSGRVESELLLLQVAAYAVAPTKKAAEEELRQAVDASLDGGVSGVIERHLSAWRERWWVADLRLEGDEALQKALRFAIHHLIAAADPGSEQTSIGARGLTGGAYLGHVFWDTEVFLRPFFDACWPEAARAMLMYRYHTLDAARRKAASRGYRGALYAWESADTGDEATPAYAFAPDGNIVLIKSGEQEQHISADVAYACWRYWLASGDDSFLARYGAEIILETARFWASRAELGGDGRYHIRGVIGPDEYHDDVDDNAFTNGMARWNLRAALRLADLLPAKHPAQWSELKRRIELEDAELDEWRQVADGLVLLEDSASRVIEQFEGFFGLTDIDLSAFQDRSVPMDVLLGPDVIANSQVSKQADVLMLMALLPDEFSQEQLRANFAYYEPRCGHGSSLSAPVHALVAARLGETDKALDYLQRTAAIDLADTFQNAAGGLHMAALGGMWQAVVHGFAGLRLEEDVVRLRPQLPTSWRLLQFRVLWRGRKLEVRLTPEVSQVRLIAGPELRVDVDGEEGVASSGRPYQRARQQ